MSSKKPVAEDIDCLVVGGGPAGIYALKFLSDAQAGATEIGLVESGSSLGGRAKSALHLIDSDLSSPFPILTGTLLGPPVVRWERNWVPMDKVNWSDKDWIGRLPQWDLLAPGLKMLLMEVSIPELGENAFMKVQSPVSRLSELEDGRWEVVTPDVTYTSKRVIWAAGMKPFQNAFGKQEAQAHLVANPNYSSVAADFRGGVALDIEVPRNVVWEEGFNSEGIFGLPVRFEGKLHLMIGVLHEDGDRLVLKTLTHAHYDLLGDPKIVSGFQKALRRGLKALVQGELPESLHEHWVVSDRVMGHRLGTPWLFEGHRGSDASLVFVGDESILSESLDTLGALESVAKTLGVVS